jgi:hypothetical protein
MTGEGSKIEFYRQVLTVLLKLADYFDSTK